MAEKLAISVEEFELKYIRPATTVLARKLVMREALTFQEAQMAIACGIDTRTYGFLLAPKSDIKP